MGSRVADTGVGSGGRAGRVRKAGALAWVRLARVARDMMRAEARRLRPDGLTVAEVDVIAQVGARAGLSQQELSAALLVTQGNVTYHLDKLARRGLVERRADGRCNRLYLTEPGRALHEQIVPRQEDWHAERFSVLTPQEQRTLLALLRKLERAYC